MQEIFLRYLIMFFTLISLCKCTNQTEPRYINKSISTDFYKEIPVIKEGWQEGENEFFYKNINEISNLLQLDSLENGYDSLQIRIWLGHSMASLKHIIILKLKNKKWKGQLIAYSDDYETYGSYNKIKNIYPNSGWRYLIDSLNKLGLITLPHGKDIPEYNGGGADGISYDFEIATLKKYRAFSYNNPDYYLEKYWQADNVLKIADLLEKEFNFQYLK